MRFTYCPHCGSRSTEKEIGDEGLIPFCENCSVPLWDMFTTCVICAVINEYGEIALLRQDHVSKTYHVCVAGVMKLGESAEEAARREIREELGLAVNDLHFIHSYPYEKKEMLMLGFHATVKKSDFHISGEVDAVEWFPIANALDKLRSGSIAWELVKTIKEKLCSVQ